MAPNFVHIVLAFIVAWTSLLVEAKRSAREDIYRLSAEYRRTQPSFVNEEETRRTGPKVSQSAAQATIISAL